MKESGSAEGAARGRAQRTQRGSSVRRCSRSRSRRSRPRSPAMPRCWSSRSSARSIPEPSATPRPTDRRTTRPTSCARQMPPRGFDLGPAAVIDEAIDELRKALRDPRRADVKERARAVDERVMRPLRASLGGVVRLIVSPDGELNLVPFEALVDESGRYLIERYAMSYVTSGRDLLRMQMARAAGSQPVIFADPLFGEPAYDRRPDLESAAAAHSPDRAAQCDDGRRAVLGVLRAARGDRGRSPRDQDAVSGRAALHRIARQEDDAAAGRSAPHAAHRFARVLPSGCARQRREPAAARRSRAGRRQPARTTPTRAAS